MHRLRRFGVAPSESLRLIMRGDPDEYKVHAIEKVHPVWARRVAPPRVLRFAVRYAHGSISPVAREGHLLREAGEGNRDMCMPARSTLGRRNTLFAGQGVGHEIAITGPRLPRSCTWHSRWCRRPALRQ